MVTTLKINPFSLDSAQTAWKKPDEPLSTKIWGVAQGAAKDIFMTNPYELTVGNFSRVFLSNESSNYSPTAKTAVGALVAFGAFYSLMLYGGTIYSAGHLIHKLGLNGNLTSIAIVGQKIKSIGNFTFLSGSVPVYAVTYAFPKNVIKNIPALIKFLSKKIEAFVTLLFKNIIVPLFDNIFYPLLNGIYKVLTWTWTRIEKVLSFVVEKIEQVVVWTFENVIAPLWNHVIAPILDRTIDLITWTWERLEGALRFIVRNIGKVVTRIFVDLLVPFFKHVILPTIKGLYNALSNICTRIEEVASLVVRNTVQAATWVFNHLIVPLWKHVIVPTWQIIVDVGHAVGDVMSIVVRNTRRAATWIFNHLMVPLWNHVFAPIWQIVVALSRAAGDVIYIIASKVAEVFAVIYRATIPPTISGVVYIGSEIGNAAYLFKQACEIALEKISKLTENLQPKNN